MADIINLNKRRKAKATKVAKTSADANRIRFGRTKAEKARDAAEGARVAATLDNAKRD